MIAIYTNRHSDCGISAYASDLESQLKKWFKVKVVEAGLSPSGLFGCKGAEVAILNWHPGRSPLNEEVIKALHSYGTKTILVFHNSSDIGGHAPYGEDSVLRAVDVVVAHEHIDPSVPFKFIPHGIPEFDNLPGITSEPSIGTAGFPFPWKRVDLVVSIAERLGCRAHIIAPKYERVFFEAQYDDWKQRLSDRLELWTDFRPKEEVVRQLARSWVNIFWFQSYCIDDQLGQTGSARMGVSAERPMIISRHRKFKTFLPYLETDFYLAEKEGDVIRSVERIFDGVVSGGVVKRPIKTLSDQGWTRVGKMFASLIQGLVRQ